MICPSLTSHISLLHLCSALKTHQGFFPLQAPFTFHISWAWNAFPPLQFMPGSSTLRSQLRNYIAERSSLMNESKGVLLPAQSQPVLTILLIVSS